MEKIISIFSNKIKSYFTHDLILLEKIEILLLVHCFINRQL